MPSVSCRLADTSNPLFRGDLWFIKMGKTLRERARKKKKDRKRINREFPAEHCWRSSRFFDLSGQLAPSNLTAYIVNEHTLSVTWDLPSNVNAIEKIFITVIELGQTNRTIQTQSFDNSIKKLDIQINANDPFSMKPRSFQSASLTRLHVCSLQVFIRIVRFSLPLGPPIAMGRTRRQLNTNSMSICTVSWAAEYMAFCFVLYFRCAVAWASDLKLSKDSLEKAGRHLLALLSGLLTERRCRHCRRC